MPETPPLTSVTQPIDVTSSEAEELADALNDANHLDAYGAVWTAASATSSDENQIKRRLRLLYLYTKAIG